MTISNHSRRDQDTMWPEALRVIHQRMTALATRDCSPDLGPVFGAGNPASALALVGEAPGEREVAEGFPFAGPAGRLLDTLLGEAGLRRADLWLTNVVKCRPVRDDGPRRQNRTPLVGEIKTWLPLLREELAVVQPRLVVCLGGTAAKALLGRDFRLTEQRGAWQPGPFGDATLATFHPAYVLHLQQHNPEGSEQARALLRLDLRAVAARVRAGAGAN